MESSNCSRASSSAPGSSQSEHNTLESGQFSPPVPQRKPSRHFIEFRGAKGKEYGTAGRTPMKNTSRRRIRHTNGHMRHRVRIIIGAGGWIETIPGDRECISNHQPSLHIGCTASPVPKSIDRIRYAPSSSTWL